MNTPMTRTALTARQFHTKGANNADDNDDDDATVRREISRIGAEFSSFATARKSREAEHDARLLALEQRSARPSSVGKLTNADSLGSQVEQAFGEGHARDLLKKTGRLTLEIKAGIGTANTAGSHGSRDVPTAPGASSTSLMSLMSPGDMAGLTTLHYARRIGVTGAAAVQDGEGAIKASSEPIFVAQAQNAITVAGFATISEQALDAAGGLQRAVDSHLSRSVRECADGVLISGTAATAWPFGGFQSLAAPFLAATGYTSVLDAVISAAVRMRLMGFNPTICVLPEAGFLQTQLAKGVDGHYLQAAGLLRDAGLSLALSSSITAGKALLLDPAFAGYLSSGVTRISLGVTGDQFVRNQRTMRAETELIPFLADFEAAMLVTPSVT